MLQPNPNGDWPRLERTAFVHETAVVLGHVRVGKNVFIGPHAVVRADEPGPDGQVQPVVIEAGANVQDAVVIHSLGGGQVVVGRRASLAHAALVHGPAEIGPQAFIGFHSVVFKSVLGARAVVMHQALVEGVAVPANRLVPAHTCLRWQGQAGALAPVDPETAAFARKVSRTNLWLAQANRGQSPLPPQTRSPRKPAFFE